jgi:hypothetical protein
VSVGGGERVERIGGIACNLRSDASHIGRQTSPKMDLRV